MRWSYPNIHGDAIFRANATGVRQGSLVHYDPFGERTATPNNASGDFDYTWLGAHQRPTEHQGNLDTIEMGHRPYIPGLGRFTTTDPIPGGNPNTYTYPADPVNQADLTGLCAEPGGADTPLACDVGAGAGGGSSRSAPRLARDSAVNSAAPQALPLNRPVGASSTQNQFVQSRIAALQGKGATAFRVNQQQVNVNGARVGINRPDLQYTLNGRRFYEEFDMLLSGRGPGHALRLEANDPFGIVNLFTVN